MLLEKWANLPGRLIVVDDGDYAAPFTDSLDEAIAMLRKEQGMPTDYYSRSVGVIELAEIDMSAKGLLSL